MGDRKQSPEYYAAWYQKNRDRILARGREYYRKNRAKIAARQREYCHRPEVRKQQTQRIWYRLNTDPVLRQHHNATNRRWAAKNKDKVRKWSTRDLAARRAIVDRSKFGKACPCGEREPICLDYHHRDPKTKIDTIAHMVAKRRSGAKILAEIAKCDLICANCHRKLHKKEALRRTA